MIGAPRCWFIIKPTHYQRLEELVSWTNYDAAEPPPTVIECHQLIGHRTIATAGNGVALHNIEDPGGSLYFTEGTLQTAGIEYTRVVQHPGEMLILFPFAYHQWFNMGPNIVESMAYASDRWEIFPKARLFRPCTSDCFRGYEPLAVNLDFAKPPPRDVEDEEEQ